MSISYKACGLGGRLMRFLFHQLRVWCVALLLVATLACAEPIRLATYNLNNYLVMDRYVNGTWRKSYPKPEAEKSVLRSIVKEVSPDILALQEMGPLPFLKEFKADLAQEGIDYSYWTHMQGDDSVRYLAVLSKLPPSEVIRHTDLEFSYQGERAFVKRGMLELSFERSSGDVFKLFVVHLKSRWTNVQADSKSLQRRTLEAEACRDRIIERTFAMGVTDFIIAGDFNDHPESAPLRRFYRRGDLKIGTLVPVADSRGDRWTHYYKKQVVYSLVDGFIASEAFFPKIKNERGHIVDGANVLKGSDHRMVYLDLL